MRGQTTLDFAIGVSVFLAVMLFVFAFAPGILEPFTVSGQEDTITVDRVADDLTLDALGSPKEPYVLDRHCTVAFFDRSDTSSPARCRWPSGDLTDALGLRDRTNVNVTITGNVSTAVDGDAILEWDDSARELVETGGDTRLAVGDAPPTSTSTTVSAIRVVTLNREDVTIEVVLW